MLYKLNNYNYITEYATIGGYGENGEVPDGWGEIEVNDNIENIGLLNFTEYQVIDNNLIHNKPKNNTDHTLIEPVYTGKTWVEGLEGEKLLNALQNKIIEKNKENNAYTVSNFANKELEKEIKELEQKHLEVSMELVFEGVV